MTQAEPESKPHRFFCAFFVIMYFLFLTGATLYVFKKPAYNWDMLGYMAVVVSASHTDAKDIHSITYSAAKAHTPPHIYSQLTDTTHHFRKKITNNPEVFQQQLAYYIVKPLYVGLVYLFYHAGASLVTATLLPSVFSYFLIGVLLFSWLRRYLSIGMTFVVSILLMLASPLLHTAELSTPDCLSALLLLYSFYLIIEKKKLATAYIFLILSVFARMDNLIVSFLLILFLSFGNKWGARVNRKQFVLMLAGLIAAYFITSYGATLYGWDILFLPSFLSASADTPYSSSNIVSVTDWLLLRHSAVMVNMLIYHLFIYFSVAALLFIDLKRFRWKYLSLDQAFVMILLLAIIMRLVIHPEMPDRFYIAYYLVIIALLVRKISVLIKANS